MVLVVNLIGIGDDMLSLPIKAESRPPEVEIEPMPTIDFKTVFLNNPYQETITLYNKSALKAKYEIMP